MRNYNKLTYFENLIRRNILCKFRTWIINYFNMRGYESQKTDDSKEIIRSKINMNMHKINSIIVASGVSPDLTWSPAPIIGGSPINVNLICDIFNLSDFQIHPVQVIDIVDRAMGVYENDKIASLIRTINPFFWINLFLVFIIGLPFRFIGKLGINTSSFESSFIGKILKGVMYIVPLIAAILTIIYRLGYLDSFKTFIGIPIDEAL